MRNISNSGKNFYERNIVDISNNDDEENIIILKKENRKVKFFASIKHLS